MFRDFTKLPPNVVRIVLALSALTMFVLSAGAPYAKGGGG
jgi:hypothetical protein